TRGDVVERRVPRDPLPLAAAARPHALERMADPLGVFHLVQRGRPLRAVPAAAAGVLGIPLELLELARLAVGVSQEPAPRLAVEAAGRERGAAPPPLPGRRGRAVLPPVAPRGGGGKAGGRGRPPARGGGEGFHYPGPPATPLAPLPSPSTAFGLWRGEAGNSS